MPPPYPPTPDDLGPNPDPNYYRRGPSPGLPFGPAFHGFLGRDADPEDWSPLLRRWMERGILPLNSLGPGENFPSSWPLETHLPRSSSMLPLRPGEPPLVNDAPYPLSNLADPAREFGYSLESPLDYLPSVSPDQAATARDPRLWQQNDEFMGQWPRHGPNKGDLWDAPDAVRNAIIRLHAYLQGRRAMQSPQDMARLSEFMEHPLSPGMTSGMGLHYMDDLGRLTGLNLDAARDIYDRMINPDPASMTETPAEIVQRVRDHNLQRQEGMFPLPNPEHGEVDPTVQQIRQHALLNRVSPDTLRRWVLQHLVRDPQLGEYAPEPQKPKQIDLSKWNASRWYDPRLEQMRRGVVRVIPEYSSLSPSDLQAEMQAWRESVLNAKQEAGSGDVQGPRLLSGRFYPLTGTNPSESYHTNESALLEELDSPHVQDIHDAIRTIQNTVGNLPGKSSPQPRVGVPESAPAVPPAMGSAGEPPPYWNLPENDHHPGMVSPATRAMWGLAKWGGAALNALPFVGAVAEMVGDPASLKYGPYRQDRATPERSGIPMLPFLGPYLYDRYFNPNPPSWAEDVHRAEAINPMAGF